MSYDLVLMATFSLCSLIIYVVLSRFSSHHRCHAVCLHVLTVLSFMLILGLFVRPHSQFLHIVLFAVPECVRLPWRGAQASRPAAPGGRHS